MSRRVLFAAVCLSFSVASAGLFGGVALAATPHADLTPGSMVSHHQQRPGVEEPDDCDLDKAAGVPCGRGCNHTTGTGDCSEEDRRPVPVKPRQWHSGLGTY